MGRIFCLIGKSSSGKDTIYQAILAQAGPELVPITLYTTRPKRVSEVEGSTYHFVTDGQLADFERQGRVIEKRQYHTTKGLWTYFTLKFDLEPDKNYITITTPEGAAALIGVYGADAVSIVYLDLDDRLRLLRCIDREANQTAPDYAEVCRRFLADGEDFAPDKLARFPGLTRIDTSLPIRDCLARWEQLYQAR